MELWDRLLTLFRMMRGYGLRHYELTQRLQMALEERANQEQRPAEEIQEELLAAGLDHLKTMDGLKESWGKLSRREQEVAAYTCLRYTNRQMTAKNEYVTFNDQGLCGECAGQFSFAQQI